MSKNIAVVQWVRKDLRPSYHGWVVTTYSKAPVSFDDNGIVSDVWDEKKTIEEIELELKANEIQYKVFDGEPDEKMVEFVENSFANTGAV